MTALIISGCAVVVVGSGVWLGRIIWRKPQQHLPSLSSSAVRRLLDGRGNK